MADMTKKLLTSAERKAKFLKSKAERLSKMPSNKYVEAALKRVQAQLKQVKGPNET